MSRLSAREPATLAHIIHRFDVGGMENGLVNLINGLPGDRYRHAVICLTASGRSAARIRNERCTIHELHKQDGKSPAVYFRFWKLLLELRPDIVHTRNLGTLDLAPVARLAGVRVCIHGEHGWDVADLKGQSVKYRYLRKVCDRFITEYVAVSKDIATWLDQMHDRRFGRVTQIYNGVDTEKYCPGGNKAILPLTNNANEYLVFGAVGRLDPIKNFDVLIEAFHRLSQEWPSDRQKLRLVIIGDGQMKEALQSQVLNLGLESMVWLAGGRDDIPQLLRSMDIFVLPSRNEGISNTILEAMACRLPIIATNVGGNPELIVDKDSGTLVRSGDVEELVSAMSDYAGDSSLRKRHGTAARMRVEISFSLDAMVGAYGSLYNRLLSNRPQTRTV